MCCPEMVGLPPFFGQLNEEHDTTSLKMFPIYICIYIYMYIGNQNERIQFFEPWRWRDMGCFLGSGTRIEMM